MGNSIAKPSKFLDCLDEDGDLDVVKFIEYKKIPPSGSVSAPFDRDISITEIFAHLYNKGSY